MAEMALDQVSAPHRVRRALAEAFLAGIARQRTLEGLVACFRYPVLAPECGIGHFYALYGIRPPSVQ